MVCMGVLVGTDRGLVWLVLVCSAGVVCGADPALGWVALHFRLLGGVCWFRVSGFDRGFGVDRVFWGP